MYKKGVVAVLFGLCVGLAGCGGGSTEAPGVDQGLDGPKVSVIATGAELAGANGVALGPDGHLYVASVLGSNLTVVDAESGDILKEYGIEEGVIGPDDVAFASDGSFFWTSIMTGEVAGFNAAGEKVIAANLTPGVNPITFSDDDRLFVSQCFFGTHLFEVDPKGEAPARLIDDTLGPGCGLNGMDWGPDGRLYGPRWFRGEVVSFDVDEGDMRVEASGFVTPAAVKFNANGVLHVLDTGAGDVVRIDAEGDHEIVAKLSPGLDNFVFDDEGRIFVSSFTDGFITRVNLDGSQTELLPGGIAHAGGITYHQGQLVLADLHGIRGFDSEGKNTFNQRNVLGMGAMGGALNVSSDGDDLILVSWVDNDVRIWNQTEGTRRWEKSGLSAPVAAVRYDGLVVVAEHGQRRVVAFNDSGEEVAVYASGLTAPTGLFVSDGDLLVSDRGLGQILKIARGGQALAQPEILVDGLVTPEGFVQYQGHVAVVEADAGRVTVIKSDGERVTVAEIPPGSQAASAAQPPSQVFNGIAVDDRGRLYLPGEPNRLLYRIDGAW